MTAHIEFARRLRALLAEKGAKPADLARAVKTSDANIKYWLDGDIDPQKIRHGNMRSAAFFLGVTTDYLASGRLPKTYSGSTSDEFDNASVAAPDVLKLPVLNYVQAGFASEVNDPYPRGQGMDVITVDAGSASGLSRTAFALEIEGDSMTPEFMPGDRVIIDPEVRPRPGDFVVAKVDGDTKATFKKYRDRGNDAAGQPVFELVPLNADYPTVTINSDRPGRVIGVMVEHRKPRRR